MYRFPVAVSYRRLRGNTRRLHPVGRLGSGSRFVGRIGSGVRGVCGLVSVFQFSNFLFQNTLRGGYLRGDVSRGLFHRIPRSMPHLRYYFNESLQGREIKGQVNEVNAQNTRERNIYLPLVDKTCVKWVISKVNTCVLFSKCVVTDEQRRTRPRWKSSITWCKH